MGMDERGNSSCGTLPLPCLQNREKSQRRNQEIYSVHPSNCMATNYYYFPRESLLEDSGHTDRWQRNIVYLLYLV